MDIDEFRKKFFVKDGKLVGRNKNKYRNNKVAKFYSDLVIKKKANLIADFERQVQYDIRVNNIHIAKYFLDFKVINLDGSINYYDVKGKDKISGKWITTDVFALKKKLVEAIYGIKIEKI